MYVSEDFLPTYTHNSRMGITWYIVYSEYNGSLSSSPEDLCSCLPQLCSTQTISVQHYMLCMYLWIYIYTSFHHSPCQQICFYHFHGPLTGPEHTHTHIHLNMYTLHDIHHTKPMYGSKQISGRSRVLDLWFSLKRFSKVENTTYTASSTDTNTSRENFTGERAESTP